MPFSARTVLTFRLKLLLAMLAAGAAGASLTYGAFKSALVPFSEEAAGGLLLSHLELRGAVIDAEIREGVEKARFTAARKPLRELLAKYAISGSAGERSALKRLLEDSAAADPAVSDMDLAEADGKIVVSLEGGGGIFSGQPRFRRGPMALRVSQPRAANGGVVWDVTVPVPSLTATTSALGTLRCRFKLFHSGSAGINAGEAPGFSLGLAGKGAGELLLAQSGGFKPVALRSPEGEPFLAALAGKKGAPVYADGRAGNDIYAWKPLQAAEWVIAGRAPLGPFSAGAARLAQKAGRRALLGFIFLAAAVVPAAAALAARLAEPGRQAAALLEQCGGTPGDRTICEPEDISDAIAEASAALRRQTSRDLELETEAEKLREEEADLKSQNDELEKLNKYLMEREVKISELKQEIAELREKVGNGVRE